MARSLKPKTRFDVFNRDGFICQYCGKTPPTVVLEVDHIIPVSAGGVDSIENLLTACFDCNRGKGASSLDSIPKTVLDQTGIILEREAQLKEYNKAIKSKQKRIKSEVTKIDSIFVNSFWSTHSVHLSDSFKDRTVTMFLERIPFADVEDAMRKACLRISEPEAASKYFCGICWNRINGVTNG